MPRDQKLKMREIGEFVANLLYFCLDPIGRSPILPLQNLHKVELFSVLYHTKMIFQVGNVHESVSLFNLKEKKN